MNETYNYFATYVARGLPLRLLQPLGPAELDNRNTFVRAAYDDAGRVAIVDKIVYGEVELSHRYSYREDGSLLRACIVVEQEERFVEFDEQGNPTSFE